MSEFAVQNQQKVSTFSGVSKSDLQQPQKYTIKPNGVDKTPDKDTVEVSSKKNTAKKVGIGAAIIAAGIGLYYLCRGKKPPKQVVEQVEQAIAHEPPKMQMTEEAKKAYDNVASKLNKKSEITAESIDRNLAPKQKDGAWDSKDMKEYYTQFEKESAEKAAKEAEAKAAKEAAEKAAKEAEAKAAKEAAEKAAKEAEAKAVKELETLKPQVETMTPRELSDLRYDLDWKGVRHFELEAYRNGWKGDKNNINKFLSREDYMQYKTSSEKLSLVKKQIRANEAKLEDFRPTVCEGSEVPMHHGLNGINPEIRNGKIKTDVIDAAFDKLPPTEKEYIVYRGRTEDPIRKSANVDFDIVANANVGDTIVPDTAYSYTGFKRSLVDTWGGPGAVMTDLEGNRTRQIMYTIHIPKGAKVSRNYEHGGEVVMPRGAEYKVLSKTVDKNGCIELECEYILPQTK